MKAIFFTEGGRNFGFGHVVRCAAMKEAFEEKGVASEFIVNADHTVGGILEDTPHRVCDWLKEKEKVLGTIGKDDVVIVDSYLADLKFYKDVSRRARKAVYLDDHKRINYPKGIVVNSTIYAQELRYPVSDGNVYLLGTQYASLRKEFWDVAERKRAGNVQKILITFGGTDYSGLIHKITDYFKNKSDCVFNSINFNKKKINAAGFLRLIFDSDLCISGGGQTVFNLARCGLPTIGVCLSDNQLLNLTAWGKTKFLEFIGRPQDDDLLEKIGKFVDAPGFREFLKRGRIGQKYIDGQGARRVVRAVLSQERT